MAYVVLARKWRPQQFADVLGQEHVTQTLTNAIEADRIAHAFLFSGPRGVGKTSAARILAKGLCCEAQDGPTARPCGECRQCVEITQGASTDVFEIDAASHTGVDNVREIIDNVRYMPSSARFKIYVIDEVHMLSTGAFNALLKTLEEPPPHVKFVLATTDPHRVPVTILSRCQRYDFRRIALSRIVERLSWILGEEGVEHDPTALTLVAREAEGSMRDAQSLLEQVLAYAGDRFLDGAVVRESLGVVDGALVERAFHALLGRDPADAIRLVGDVNDRGLDLKRFAEALIEHARDLLVARVVPEPGPSLDRPADEVDRLVTQARQYGPATFERLFEQLCRVAEEVGKASYPRFALEVGLAGLAEAPAAVDLEAVLSQLSRVEGMLGPSGSSGSSGGRAPPGGGGPSGRSPRSAGSKTAGGHARSGRGAPVFEDFVAMVRQRRPSLSATLVQVRPLVFEPGRVRLGCETSFDATKLQEPDTREDIEALLTAFLGVPSTIEIVRSDGKEAPRTITETEEAKRAAHQEAVTQAALQHPAVKAVTGALGAEVTGVRVQDEG